MPSKSTIGFIGAGKMATALAKGFVTAGLAEGGSLVASDISQAARESFERETGGKATESNLVVVAECETVVLAVKPGQAISVLSELRTTWTAKHLLISIAAGVPLAKLEAALPENARVIRVMPNTPALAGASATAYSPGHSTQPEDGEYAQKLFSSVGLAAQVNETLLDAVTGLSGSGPAYVCLFIEALADGGVAAGLPRELASRLAAQTLIGTAKMMIETGLHPAVLKDMVASPGGTTIEGLHELEKGAFRGTLINAVRAAAEKSRRLGQ